MPLMTLCCLRDYFDMSKVGQDMDPPSMSAVVSGVVSHTLVHAASVPQCLPKAAVTLFYISLLPLAVSPLLP